MNSENSEHQKKPKIKINTLINIVLLIGLIVLYGLYFIDFEEKPKVESKEIQAIERTLSDATLSIGFINTEKLLEQYEFAQKMRDDMFAEQQRLESNITRRQREFQRKVENFQRQVQQGRMSMEQAQIEEQELMQEQQELMMLTEEYSERLRQKEIDLNIELFDSIASAIKKYNEKFGFDFVLNYSLGGGMLYGAEEFDITDDFINTINKPQVDD